MEVRLDGEHSDLITSRATWDRNCTETTGGKEAVLSYSDGSVKYPGTIGSGAWHVKKLLGVIFKPGVPRCTPHIK